MVEQQPRYSNEELSLFKNTFAENDDLLILLRKVMLQAELTEAEDIMAKNVFGKPNVAELLRRQFLPEIEPDAPVNQIIDMWVEVYNNNKDRSIADIAVRVEARAMVIEYIHQQLEYIENSKESTMSIEAFNVNADNLVVTFLARNDLYKHIESQLMFIKIMAGKKDETPDETMKRIKKDSSK